MPASYWWTKPAILKVIQWWTDSQCSCWSNGVIPRSRAMSEKVMCMLILSEPHQLRVQRIEPKSTCTQPDTDVHKTHSELVHCVWHVFSGCVEVDLWQSSAYWCRCRPWWSTARTAMDQALTLAAHRTAWVTLKTVDHSMLPAVYDRWGMRVSDRGQPQSYQMQLTIIAAGWHGPHTRMLPRDRAGRVKLLLWRQHVWPNTQHGCFGQVLFAVCRLMSW